MKNFSKILCVVLALVMALSAASCSLSQQYAYQQDDIELPIGVYLYYLYSAYNNAQSYAQQSDLYDADSGKYDGKKSFLKMEITDDDGETAVAEDWIKNKAEENTKNAVAINTKFNELGCTIDQTEIDSTKSYYKSYWDQSYAEMLEPYGISFDSFFEAGYMIPVMESEAFKAEYGEGGPSEVATPDLAAYFEENYTSYKYFSVNLYTTESVEGTDDSEETATENVALSEDKINEYKDAFDEYASTLSDGGSYEDVIEKYMDAFDVEEDPTTESVEIIDEDTTDEIIKTIKDMKDGQAMTMEVGDDDTSKQLYLIYREPIENQVEAYTDPEQHKDDVLSSMKHEDFDELLKDLAEELNITLSSSCGSYKPSLFEETK
ncbi:MAG: hypothetical protein IJH07_01005 [Ruminococcus sp.]|nr:hypothetical protein [Ruminococcus sp.]